MPQPPNRVGQCDADQYSSRNRLAGTWEIAYRMRRQRRPHQLRCDWLGVMLLGNLVQRCWFDQLSAVRGKMTATANPLFDLDDHSQPITDWGMRAHYNGKISRMFKIAGLSGLSCLFSNRSWQGR